MLLPIAGALITAAAVVLVAHALRERRAMRADLRALRADVRRLSRALEARGTERRDEKPDDAAPARTGSAERALATEHAVQGRGSRTLH